MKNICTCVPGKDQDETTTLCPACINEMYLEYKTEKKSPIKKAKYSLNGRAVENIETEGSYDEMFVISAQYVDNGAELSEDDLDALGCLYNGELAQDLYERTVDYACDYYEGDR